MRRRIGSIAGLVLATPLAAAVAFAGEHVAGDHAAAKPQDIVGTAIRAREFKTLVKAVDEAGLVGTLRDKGPFTAFAWTDAVFAKLPPGTLDGLLADRTKLVTVLAYQLVPGKLVPAYVGRRDEAKTVEGSLVEISSKDGARVEEAAVVRTDIFASSDLIHAIDAVIIPD